MAKRGPGTAHREGLTVIELFKMFPDDAAAEAWFEDQRWPDGRFCSDCRPTNTVVVKSRKPIPYRYRDCRNHFSVRESTVMQSSMKLYPEVGIRQATAWFLFQRIREGFDQGDGLPLPGPVEAAETFIGNTPNAKRAQPTRRGGADKTVIPGVKDRAINRIAVRPVPDASGEPLNGFVKKKTRRAQ